MSDTLTSLEARSVTVQSQLVQLGNMRSGSITSTSGRCGNPRCHCHQPGDAGHGPYHRLTRKVGGKTLTETFGSPAALAKAQGEIAEYHRFRTLGDELLAVNEQICARRPVAEPPEAVLEKKRRKRSVGRLRGK